KAVAVADTEAAAPTVACVCEYRCAKEVTGTGRAGGSGLGTTASRRILGTCFIMAAMLASACTVTMAARGYSQRRNRCRRGVALVQTAGLVRSHTITGTCTPQLAM